MSRFVACGVGVLAMIGSVSVPAAPLQSGVELKYVDHSVRPQDDLYRYLNGKWLDSFQIPPDKGSYGSFTYLDGLTQEQLRGIIDGLAGNAVSEARTIADLFASFMDEHRLESLRIRPLRAEFAAIDAISGKSGIPPLIAHLNRIGAVAPYVFSINQDARNSLQYAVIIRQSGLGMPDRDYYLKDDAKLKDTRAKYQAHIAKMLDMAGDTDSAAHAAAPPDLETALPR